MSRSELVARMKKERMSRAKDANRTTLVRALEYLTSAWTALSEYQERNPLPENGVSEISITLSLVEDAIDHLEGSAR